ncbi:MAG: TA system antitoxin ParD family protein [Solimonas sp.]
MAALNHPMRLDPELTASAKSTAEHMSRSLSQQVAHWARIGRELERSPGVTVSDVQAVLEGRGDYDRLNIQEQAIVRANWAERIEETRKNLRLDRVLAAQGREVVELDARGHVTVGGPQGKPARRTTR